MVGLSAPALLRRFGSKEELLFRSLLPQEAPRWWSTIRRPPTADRVADLAGILAELAQDFESVGAALFTLRTGPLDVGAVFPRDQPGPSLAARAAMTRWLAASGVDGPVDVLADLVVGAAEARGFLRWVGPPMTDDDPHEVWAERVARAILT